MVENTGKTGENTIGLSTSLAINPETVEQEIFLMTLIPDKGYVKGNVHWISRRANRIKSDATVEELEKIISYMKDNDGE